MAHANVVLNFNAFLKKTKLKDDGSNYTDWVRNLRIILIAANSAEVCALFPARLDLTSLACTDMALEHKRPKGRI